MSTIRIRPELTTTDKPCMSVPSAYYRVMQAVAHKRSLIHGKLHDNGKSCAIGAAFDDGVDVLPTSVIDEVATYNDSFPHLTPHERWKKVMKWLRWRVALRPNQCLQRKKSSS